MFLEINWIYKNAKIQKSSPCTCPFRPQYFGSFLKNQNSAPYFFSSRTEVPKKVCPIPVGKKPQGGDRFLGKRLLSAQGQLIWHSCPKLVLNFFSSKSIHSIKSDSTVFSWGLTDWQADSHPPSHPCTSGWANFYALSWYLSLIYVCLTHSVKGTPSKE